MRTLRTSRPAKVTAFLLCVLSLTLALCCAGPLAWTTRMGAGEGYDTYKDNVEELLLENYVTPLTSVLQDFTSQANLPQADPDQRVRALLRDVASWMDQDGNLFYTVRGADGRLIQGSETLGDYRAKHTQTVTLPEIVTVRETYDSAAERDGALDRLRNQYEEVSVLYASDPSEVSYRLTANCYQGRELADTVDMTFFSREQAQSMAAELLETYDRVDYDIQDEGAWSLEAQCVSWEGGETLTVNGFLRAVMAPGGQIWRQLTQTNALYNARPVYQVLLPAGVALGLLCLAFLLWSAGHERDRAGIALTALDRKGPADLLLLVGLAAMLVWLAAGMDTADWQGIPTLFPLLPYGLLCLALAFGLYPLLSLVRRGKARQPGGLLLARAGRLCLRGLNLAGRGLEKLADRLPLFGLAAAVFLVCALAEGLSVAVVAQHNYGGVLLWFLLKALELAGVIWLVLSFRRLQEGGKELAAGNLDYQVPLDRLRGPFRAHGEDLNAIRDAIQGAVEERMKSERMKTALITNVSHDIKTPLTAIVSYVDLLKQQPMPNDEARTYLEVLERQSARLKKLTEDLVEASKASTGNVAVDLAPTDVNLLLAQSAGEYQERLQAAGLTLVLDPAPEDPVILADGSLLGRVFDNLLSNIQKYAQPSTRVYLSSRVEGDRVSILFRNISARPLNISAEELVERFVRGDEARSTEGSGLGLAIAQDLTHLQGGAFSLAIDGDLFKAKVSFPLSAS